MSDILSTSVSGLLAFQRALSVTSNNISNVATLGYSVEHANFTPQPGQSTSVGYFGSGVTIESVTRSYDELLASQVRTSQSGYSSFNTYATQAGQIDNMLSSSSTGLTASLQAFVNALHTVANSPASTPQRQALLSQAQAQQKAIERVTGATVEPLLVFSRAWVDRPLARRKGVRVVPARMLLGYLSRREAVLSRAEIGRAQSLVVTALLESGQSRPVASDRWRLMR